ncbi:MAG: hypothetical protein AAF654_00025 [Myxococcota bacterium]
MSCVANPERSVFAEEAGTAWTERRRPIRRDGDTKLGGRRAAYDH